MTFPRRSSVASWGLLSKCIKVFLQAPVVRKVDNAIHWISYYPVDSAIGFCYTVEPRYFEGRSNSLGFALMFSVIYYQLFRTRLFRIPRYFELIVLSLHLKSTQLFRTCQKRSTNIRAQLEKYCILFKLVLRN